MKGYTLVDLETFPYIVKEDKTNNGTRRPLEEKIPIIWNPKADLQRGTRGFFFLIQRA